MDRQAGLIVSSGITELNDGGLRSNAAAFPGKGDAS